MSMSARVRQVHKDISAVWLTFSRANCNSIDSGRIIRYANAGCVRVYVCGECVCTAACARRRVQITRNCQYIASSFERGRGGSEHNARRACRWKGSGEVLHFRYTFTPLGDIRSRRICAKQRRFPSPYANPCTRAYALETLQIQLARRGKLASRDAPAVRSRDVAISTR